MPRHPENVLFVLSPLAERFFHASRACGAALSLKHSGASRADIVADPRRSMVGHRDRFCPVPEFARMAGALSDTLFRPVVGHSDVRDLKAASAKDILRPDLKSLSTVGGLLIKSDGAGSSESDAGNLGLVLYLAIHARTPDRKPYSHLIFPELTQKAQAALFKTLGRDLRAGMLEEYGPMIDLCGARERLAAFMSRGTAPPSRTLQ